MKGLTDKQKAKDVQRYFQEAVEELILNEGDARQRVCSAYDNYLYKLHEQDMPTAVASKFLSLKNNLTKKPQKYPHRSSSQETLRGARNSTGSKYARTIFEIHTELQAILSN